MSGTTHGGAQQRAAFLAGAVEHVLARGVAGLSLRPLAAALGTSDRMLLYYFHSRDALLRAVLAAVGERLQAGLAAALPDEPLGVAALLGRIWAVAREPDVEPYLRVYVEISGLAARGTEPFRSTAAEVAEQWRSWAATRIAVPVDERASAAAGLLSVLDGLLLVRFVASEDAAADAAAWLLPRLG